MGWTAYYQVVRDRELDDSELAKVAKLVRTVQKRKWDGEAFGLVAATAQRPSRVIAKGWNKMGLSASSFDRELLVQTLDKLRALLPDAEVRVADDFGTLGKLGALVEDSDEDGWSSVLSIVPPPPPKHPAILDEALATLAAGRELDDKARTNVELIRKTFTALGKNEIEKTTLRAVADACDPDAVAHLGLSTYARLEIDARTAVGMALDRVRAPAALTDAFLHAWTTPRGLYYYGDMFIPQSFVRALGTQQRVRERWMADLDDAASGKATRDLELRRAERAVRMLGESGDPAALACLAAVVRRWRGTQPSHSVEHYGYLPALRALAEAASPTWTATTLLALDGRGMFRTGETEAVHHSLAGDLEIALPVVGAVLAHGVGIEPALQAIARAGRAAASLEDVVTPYLAYPSKSHRAAARQALVAMGANPPDDNYEKLGPERLIAHRDPQVRQSALKALHQRKDPSLFVALVHASRIDRVLCDAIGWPFTAFSWADWKDIVPKRLFGANNYDRIEWATGTGASTLGPQREIATLEPLLDLQPLELRAKIGVTPFTLDERTREALVARERAAVA